MNFLSLYGGFLRFFTAILRVVSITRSFVFILSANGCGLSRNIEVCFT